MTHCLFHFPSEDNHTFASQKVCWIALFLRKFIPADRSHLKGIARVLYYVNPETGCVLNVVATRLSAPTTIFVFHSTVVMNYITWDAVVCAYPQLLSEHRGLINTDLDQERADTEVCLTKYRSRGFQLHKSALPWFPGHVCGVHKYCGRTLRGLDDSAVLRIGLSSHDIGVSMDVVDPGLRWKLAVRGECGTPGQVVREAGWVRSGDNGGPLRKSVSLCLRYILN